MAKLRVDKIAAPIVQDEFTGSVFFDGNGDYLEVDLSTDAIGTEEFTIEMWIYPKVTSDSNNRRLIRIGPNNNANNLQILYNAGLNPCKIYNTGMEDGYGYDVKSEKYGNLIKMGVIDPMKVTKSALQNAVSVAVTILSTDAIVTMARSYETE